jgi:hypothetical protein
MFISTKYSGYNRHGEQSAAGYFLILMQPKTFESLKYPQYKKECAICGSLSSEHENKHIATECSYHGIVERLRQRARMKQEATDEDLIPSFVAGCVECETVQRLKTEAGCQFFKVQSNSYPLRAIVRYVRMRQLGHFMMGSARVNGHSLTLSGSYGSDGLPTSVPDDVYDAGVELPQYLYDAWNKGGGWNSAGSEAAQMREWAKQTFPKPTKR